MTLVVKTHGLRPEESEQMMDRLFRRTGVDGVYGRTGQYETVVDGLGRLISKHRDPSAEVIRFPPVINRKVIERLGYVKSFPNLLGCVCGLSGSDKELSEVARRCSAGEDWTDALTPNDLALTPAACYPVYPLAAERTIPPDGIMFHVTSECFRREPSTDIDRMQSFRMREYVFIGRPDHAQSFRDNWMDEAQAIADQIGLTHRVAAASDPFFGRGGILLGRAQAEQQLKYELLVPVRSAETATACMSFNYHRDHFGSALGMRDGQSEIAHSACVAFGIDRLTIALFASHGVNVAGWPSSVKTALGL